MAKEESCPLCETSCTYYHHQQINTDDGKQWVSWIECPVCGKYAITREAKDCLRDLPNRKENRYIISGVTRNRYESGEGNINIISGVTGKSSESEFMITGKMLREDSEFQVKILSITPKTVLDKASLLLQYIARKSKGPSDIINLKRDNDYPIAFCKKPEELMLYADYLVKRGFLVYKDLDCLSVTVEGWQEVENMARPNIESKQAFVAMWFDESMNDIFEKGIKPIEKDTGFNMFRVDKTHFINEKICDKIIAEIKQSRFLIADVTGQRQAVYFEAGYAMGIGMPVIWTCKESEVDSCCFDTRQYPHVTWKDAEDFRTQLKEKILATIGKAHS